jgi:hypothetical protein
MQTYVVTLETPGGKLFLPVDGKSRFILYVAHVAGIKGPGYGSHHPTPGTRRDEAKPTMVASPRRTCWTTIAPSMTSTISLCHTRPSKMVGVQRHNQRCLAWLEAC